MKIRLYTVIMLFGFVLLTACGGGGASGGGASDTPENATFDNATFDNSKWE